MKQSIYKDFKKVSEDDRVAVMAHPNGHEIRIAKESLSPKERRHLKLLPLHQAEGSQEPVQAPEGTSDQTSNDTPPKPVTININGAGAQPPAPMKLNPLQEFYNTQVRSTSNDPKNMFGPKGEQPKEIDMAAFKVAQAQSQSKKDRTDEIQAHAAEAMDAQNQARKQMGLMPLGSIPAPDAQPLASISKTMPQAVPPAVLGQQQLPPQDMLGTGAYEQTYLKGLNEQKGAEFQGANIADQLGKAQAGLINTQLVTQQNVLENYNQKVAELEKERQAFQKDIQDQHIDPQHLMHEMGTGAKITAGIGLLLGGAGAGIAHEARNPVLDQLNLQIDRDIKAQEANLGKKQSLLSANLKQFGNLRDATEMTKVMMTDILSNQLKSEAAKLQGPAAKAQALKSAGILDMQSAPVLQQIARRKALQNQMGQGGGDIDPAQLVGELVPEHLQKEAYNEIKAAQNTRHMAKNIMKSFEEAVQENTTARTGGGLLRTPGSVYALHQHMQPTFVDLESTVRQAAMDNTFRNITPMPGDTEHKISQKRQALQQYLQSKMSAPIAKGNGIDLSKFKSTAPEEETPIARVDPKSGKVALFDPTTRKFLRYK